MQKGKPGDIPENQGRLYRIGNLKEAAVAICEAEEITLSNGMDWSLDGSMFYFIDSKKDRVMGYHSQAQLKSNVKMLSMGNTVFDAKAHNVKGLLDGMAIDRRGHLWIALYDGEAVSRRIIQYFEVIIRARISM